jgi:hypothetical protein
LVFNSPTRTVSVPDFGASMTRIVGSGAGVQSLCASA